MFKLEADLTNKELYESPEKNLFAAILMRAWADLDWMDDTVRDWAFAWFDGKSFQGQRTDKGITSFKGICEVLDLDAAKTKEYIFLNSYVECSMDARGVTRQYLDRLKKRVRTSVTLG